MMMPKDKKINLLYDGQILLNQLQSGNRISRTGIFFVVYNILKQFLRRDELHVSVFTSANKDLLKKALLELYPDYPDIQVTTNLLEDPLIESNTYMDINQGAGLYDWNEAETSGRWTSKKSYISFKIDNVDVETVKVTLKINAILPSVSKVVVRNENLNRTIASFDKSEIKDEVSFSLQKSEVIDNRNVKISIEVLGASTPKDIGMNDDKRLLGIRIEEIKLVLTEKGYVWSEGYLSHLRRKNKRLKKNREWFKWLRLCILAFNVKSFLFFRKIFITSDNTIKDVDVFFSPCFALPKVVAKSKGIKKYTILYDTLPYVTPKQYYPEHGWKFLFDLYKTLNKNDYYFCISENTKNDFLKYIKTVDKKKMTTTLLAAADYFYRCKDSKKLYQVFNKYHVPNIKKYIFSLCTLDPRKNLVTPIHAFLKFLKKHNISDLYFLMGGGHVSEYLAQIECILSNYPNQRNNIIQLGYVDDEDLAVLLSNAYWDVYTPFYEGFGLPPLEAMACGCPVIASNNSSLPEVVGDAGILIDCTSLEEHIEAFEKLYYNEKLRLQLSIKGYERSKTFSWEKTADIMVQEIVKNEEN